MDTHRVRRVQRPRLADGYMLVEALVGLVLLGVGALGVAAALGQAERFAILAAQRDREAGIRADLAAVLRFGLASASGWQPAADDAADGSDVEASTSCWRRVSPAGADFLWIEARCGVGVDDLPAERREPGLLVRR